MLEKNALARTISTDWDSLTDWEDLDNTKGLDTYVPWVSLMVYKQLYGSYKNDDHTGEVVNTILLELIQGLKSGKYRKSNEESGLQFRAILGRLASGRTIDYIRKRKRLPPNVSDMIRSGDDDNSNMIDALGKVDESYPAVESPNFEEESSIGFYIETLIPFIILYDQILASLEQKNDEKGIQKQVKKILTMIIVPTLAYLDLSYAKTGTGEVSLVRQPPKALRHLIGFTEEFQRKNLDNIKNREVPQKLEKIRDQKPAATGKKLSINDRIKKYRKHLQKNLNKENLLSSQGLTGFDQIKSSKDLPEDYLNFIQTIVPKKLRHDLIKWIEHYRKNIDMICPPNSGRLLTILGKTP
jgi:hypothetical protein